MKKFIIILSIFVIAASLGIAENNLIEYQSKIYIYQNEKSSNDSKIEYINSKGKTKTFLYKENMDLSLKFNIKDREEVLFYIKGPNLFKYSYKFQGVKKEKDEDFIISEKIADQIKNLLDTMKEEIMPAAPPALVPEKRRDINDSFKELIEILKNLKDYKGKIDTLNLKDDLSKIDEVNGWQIGENKNKITKIYKEIQTVMLNILLQKKDNQKVLYKKMDMILNVKEYIFDLVNNLEKFTKIYEECQHPKYLGSIKYVSGFKQTVDIDISLTTEYKNDQNLKKFTGKSEFLFKPYIPVKLGIGAAYVFSFINTRDYSLEKLDEGYKIVASEKEFFGHDVAAMATITPNLFKGSNFNIIFELGANSIKKESLGFFAGLGIKLTQSFYIGGGYTYQKIKILEEGLNVGDILSSQDEFKTTTTFKDGFYLHITFFKENKK